MLPLFRAGNWLLAQEMFSLSSTNSLYQMGVIPTQGWTQGNHCGGEDPGCQYTGMSPTYTPL